LSDSMIDMPRRRLLRAILASLITGSTHLAISPVLAREKMTKQEAEYQDSPKDIRMCATCSFFEHPRSCKVVDGDVSPNGWCKAFALAD
jgi:High potential iron-sulfur protein